MTKIFLIRHAEAEGNLYRRIHGQYDSLVTENGKKQIEALRRRFLSERVDAVYASDLIRTRLTARAITEPKGLPLRPEPRLREIALGAWEDQPFGLIARTEPQAMEQFDHDPVHWQVPGSERFFACQSRFVQALTEIAQRHEGGTVAAVSHGSAIRGALIGLIYGEQGQKAAGHSDNTAVSCLRYDAGRWTLDYANDNSHLDESISTLARQNWWREGDREDFNLWYEPFDGAREPYCAMRREAWQGIYGNTEGLDEEGFYQELCSIRRYHPDAGAYACLHEQRIGFIQLAPARKRDEGVGYVSFVYLCPEFRGRGIGAQLIGYAVSAYRRAGRRALQLGVAEGNLRARRFYEKLGFRQVGTTPGLHKDLLLLQLDIDRTPYLLRA